MERLSRVKIQFLKDMGIVVPTEQMILVLIEQEDKNFYRSVIKKLRCEGFTYGQIAKKLAIPKCIVINNIVKIKKEANKDKL